MTNKTPRTGRRNERGGALVEFATVLPVFLIFLFGIIDFGFVFSQRLELLAGLRTATRDAAVASWTENASCSTGAADGTKDLICTVKAQFSNPVAVKVRLLDPDGGSPDYAVDNTLLVCVMEPTYSTTSFYSAVLDNHVQTGRMAVRVEKVHDSDTISEYQEPALTGGSWSFCV